MVDRILVKIEKQVPWDGALIQIQMQMVEYDLNMHPSVGPSSYHWEHFAPDVKRTPEDVLRTFDRLVADMRSTLEMSLKR